jgi:hypothetical protein
MAVSSMPFAATGLVICWNLPMKRARSSHSSGAVTGVCLSSRRWTKSNTTPVTPGALRFAACTASTM